VILVDTDVLLDIAWQRKSYWVHAADLLTLAVRQQIKMAVTPIILSNLYFLLSKHGSTRQALAFNRKILTLRDFLPHSRVHFVQAYDSDFRDKEDAVNYFTALSFKVDAIVTRNKKDFIQAQIPVFTPAEFLQRFRGYDRN
jgi:predicted nucleic acid-binding protein